MRKHRVPSLRSIFNTLGNLSLLLIVLIAFYSCDSDTIEGSYRYELFFEEDERPSAGTMYIEKKAGVHIVSLVSFERGTDVLEDVTISGSSLNGSFEKWGKKLQLEGQFTGNTFAGFILMDKRERRFSANMLSEETVSIDRSHINYMLPDNDLQETELNIDHAGLISDLDKNSFNKGRKIYNSNCINCHGNAELEGSIPLSLKFWQDPFKAGSDPYSMYQSITRGYATMPPQLTLSPREKYDVITFIREEYVKEDNKNQYFQISPGYLKGLPKGSSKGPTPQPHHPWKDQDYGNFFINTYELVDEETGIERYHSPGPSPFADEDYSKNNFAYKGIAVRLDLGEGGVAKGNAWMIFDHDLMRVAGGWTGEGFIDWSAILLNDRHETYPRTIGKLHFETPVGPGWANPITGDFDDPRFTARDGRQFGPLPKKWANYKGLYHHGDHVIVSYTVGRAEILERMGMEQKDSNILFTRTLNIAPSNDQLLLRVAPVGNQVRLSGIGASLIEKDGYVMMRVNKNQRANLKLFIGDRSLSGIDDIVKDSALPEILKKYTYGGPQHYPKLISTPIIKGNEKGAFAVDQLSPPYKNPWNCRMKLSGIDFYKDSNKAAVCTTDGDVFEINGLSDTVESLTWKRIASGLFQPLGLKILNDKVFVICRDQLVKLQDLNGDGETDFYESFNHDHQVTDHFHEFAMGLQADKSGNLYYAKSGRHAREALIPQHGTLIKVSADGSRSDIIASGFRAANGVCINPDGSFLVTDQQGYWNPMNRINWIDVDGQSKFYGNMWGYGPPADSTRAGMEEPMVWVDMEFDRSPSELLWVDSDKWGPLKGGLLSFSYGYGKIQLVLHEEIDGQKQGGVIDLPGMKFYTGVMRGRFHPSDGQMYLCGMEAWSTSQNMRTGDLYRIRYTGQPLSVPIGLEMDEEGVILTFAEVLNVTQAKKINNYQISTWDLLRSKKYGSDRHNVSELNISRVKLFGKGKKVKLFLPEIKPVDVMTISYDLTNEDGIEMKGTVQNTIHNLGKRLELQ
ncbi:MAG: hypothetical protein ACJA01_000169 [Saprospiraceae bacterium]|jgi:hypothetical protein